MSRLKYFLGGVLLCFAGSSYGQSPHTTCSASNASLSLGQYPSYSATPVDSSGVFTVTCTRTGGPPDTDITVGLGPSANSGSIPNRQLRSASGADVLNYNLYADASRLRVWGDTEGVNTVTETIRLANKTSGSLNFNIYARIDALQDVRAGLYSDSIVVTVSF
ncbi:MAG: spore coat U domain-containing protein [Pseudomonadota bacterium]